MPDLHRYIDVFAAARVSRRIEAYRARIELHVSARDSQPCLELAVSIREQVLKALADAGLDGECIEEGGGHVSKPTWSSSATATHELFVKHTSIPTLMQAMTNVERVYASFHDKWFSGIKRNFTISPPTPLFTDDPHAAEHALRQAVVNARAAATQLAAESGMQLSSIETIAELPALHRGSTFLPAPSLGESWMSARSLLDFSDADMSDRYTPASPQQGLIDRYFRIRFGMLEIPRNHSDSPSTS